MMMASYKPHQLSRFDAAVLQELILSKRIFSLSSAPSSQKIRFLREGAFPQNSFSFPIALNVNKERVDLRLQPMAGSSLMQRLSDLGGIEALPNEFAEALRAFCSKEIITAFANFFQSSATLWKEGDATETPTKELFFEINKANATVEVQGSIKLPFSLLEKLLSLATAIPVAPSRHFNTASLRGEIIIGSASLLLTDWEKLTPGALVFLQGPSAITTGEAFFYAEKDQKIPILIEKQHIKSLLRPLTKLSFAPFVPADSLEKALANPHEKKSELPQQVMPMELSFSAGAISLTLEEILLLSKNKKSPQPVVLSQPLTMLAQGRAIGLGELVSIGDQYAVFITQLTLSA